MKKQFWFLQGVLSLFAVTALLCFSSCHKGQITDEVANQKTIDGKLRQTGNNSNGLASADCTFPVFLAYIVYGQQVNGTSNCIGSLGICHIYKYISGGFIPCPKFTLPDNSGCKPCGGDPWNYTKIGDPPPYYKYFPNNSLVSTFVPIKVTSNIAVLQFYAEIKGTLNSQTLTLPASFSLTKEISQNLGLIGNTIPAGTYPVVLDTKNKTFNAIVKIQ